MNQIAFFIIGISLIMVIPLTYFCLNMILRKKAPTSRRMIIAFVYIIIMVILIVVAINLYAYLINSQDSVVSERYIVSLAENSANDNYEKHISTTRLISYPDIDNLSDVFDETAKLEIQNIASIIVSKDRWIDKDQGFTHLYMYLDEHKICYDVGMIKNGRFWDVASIEIIDENKLNLVLANVQFVKLK